MNTVSEQRNYVNYFAYVLTALALVFIMSWHLLPALLAGLLIHEVIHIIAPLVMRYGKIKRRPAKIAVVAFITAIVIILLTVMLMVVVHFFREGNENLPALLKEMANIIETKMPGWITEKISTDFKDINELKKIVVKWLQDHAGEIASATKHTLRILAHILLGMIIGAMIALHEIARHIEPKPLSKALTQRARRLARSFRQVVFAQIRISALNTLFTALYLVVLLPLFGVKLNFLVTMIALTFLFGLLPVIGNLLSNSVIVIVSFTASLNVAIASLIFLIVIHKVEYFLNARIIGSQIETRAWEILLAMVTLEALFGVTGVIAAPILYAYLKQELRKSELV